MYVLRRILYDVASLFTLVRGVRNWPHLVRLLPPSGRGIEIRLRNGLRYSVRNLIDAWVVKETVLDDHYQRFGTTIQPGWAIVDIGAGLGDFTVYAAVRARGGHVHAYEPSGESADLLARNLDANGIGNARIFPCAVARAAGRLVLDTSGGVPLHYRTAPSTKPGAATVESVTFKEVLDALPGGECDFMKMDCEGAEYDILLNLDDGLLGRMHRLCLEYHDGLTEFSHEDLIRFFSEKGCRVRRYPSPVRKRLGYLYVEIPR